MIRDHFIWNKAARKVEEEQEEVGNEEVKEEALDEMVMKVKVMLSGTQNSSASSPDSISYRFIKTIKDTILEKKVIEEVARNLIKEIILKE